MSRPLLIATTNSGKLREVAVYLAGVHGLSILSLGDVPGMPAVAEEAGTFEGNAVRKAVEYSRAASLLTLADDSGLSVDALSGAPGAASARYGGPGLDDAGRCRLLLERMAGVEALRRTARFECVLALADSGRLIATFEGRVEGTILTEPRGENGFGYDPVFFYAPSARTFAEMSAEEKSAVSHRGRALSALRVYLEENPGGIRPANEG